MIKLITLLVVVTVCYSADPTNYEVYTGGGIHSGLDANSPQFKLNGKPFRILSGSLHYFRLPWQNWKLRLDQFKAAGLNTITTYIPWNMHEPSPGKWVFDNDNLNLPDFLKRCKEADLFVFLRIGPYIDAEWENGGLPWWLFKDHNMRYHQGYKPFEDAVHRYVDKIMQVTAPYAFQKGGPIIALQFENEYGGIQNDKDRQYFDMIKGAIEFSGFRELLTNCDAGSGATRVINKLQKGVLETMNTGNINDALLLRKAQPNRPVFCTESYPGWYDNWGNQRHRTNSVQQFEGMVHDLLYKGDMSMNIYMFFGGTNFGWQAAGEGEKGPVTTSYDYDGVITEAGHYTEKYHRCRDLMTKLLPEKKLPKVHIPDPPREPSVKAYGNIKFVDYLTLDDLTNHITPVRTNQAKTMEDFDQGYGFILYRLSHAKYNQMKVPRGFNDRGILLIDGVAKATHQGTKEFDYKTRDSDFTGGSGTEILIENFGRHKFANEDINKGLQSDVLLDNKRVTDYEVFRMDFPEDWVRGLKSVKGHPFAKQSNPTLYRAELNISGTPEDTFLRFDGFKKGSVFVNGINIGRYWDIGPQKTLYLPATFLKQGQNDIYVFELSQANDHFVSTDKPDLGRSF